MITNTSRAKVQLILDHIAKYFMLDVEDLVGTGRSKALVAGRRIAMNIIRAKTVCTLEEIGSFFSGRDHSTVIFNLNTHDDLMTYNKDYRMVYEQISIAFTGEMWDCESYPLGYTLTNGVDYFGFYKIKKHASKIASELNLTIISIKDIRKAK